MNPCDVSVEFCSVCFTDMRKDANLFLRQIREKMGTFQIKQSYQKYFTKGSQLNPINIPFAIHPSGETAQLELRSSPLFHPPQLICIPELLRQVHKTGWYGSTRSFGYWHGLCRVNY